MSDGEQCLYPEYLDEEMSDGEQCLYPEYLDEEMSDGEQCLYPEYLDEEMSDGEQCLYPEYLDEEMSDGEQCLYPEYLDEEMSDGEQCLYPEYLDEEMSDGEQCLYPEYLDEEMSDGEQCLYPEYLDEEMSDGEQCLYPEYLDEEMSDGEQCLYPEYLDEEMSDGEQCLYPEYLDEEMSDGEQCLYPEYLDEEMSDGEQCLYPEYLDEEMSDGEQCLYPECLDEEMSDGEQCLYPEYLDEEMSDGEQCLYPEYLDEEMSDGEQCLYPEYLDEEMSDGEQCLYPEYLDEEMSDGEQCLYPEYLDEEMSDGEQCLYPEYLDEEMSDGEQCLYPEYLDEEMSDGEQCLYPEYLDEEMSDGEQCLYPEYLDEEMSDGEQCLYPEYLDEEMSDGEQCLYPQKRKGGSSQSTEKPFKVTRSLSKGVKSCSAADIRTFLRDTKGMRSVKVENYFPNLKLFSETARPLVWSSSSQVEDALTDQERFRLKKLLSKVRAQVARDTQYCRDRVRLEEGVGGQLVLSHGSASSAGVAVLFSRRCLAVSVETEEVVAGRLLLVRAQLETTTVTFVCVYLPCTGAQRVLMMDTLCECIRDCTDSGDVLFVAGDWNCTVEPQHDRNHPEPHPASSLRLRRLLEVHSLEDVWRTLHPGVREYTWSHCKDNALSLARLDRVYVPGHQLSMCTAAHISPVGISDHSFIVCVIRVSNVRVGSAYWHFNNSLLLDKMFVCAFKVFWESHQRCKAHFVSLQRWWDYGKVQIRQLCQEYTHGVTRDRARLVKELETTVVELQRLAVSTGERGCLQSLKAQKSAASSQ
uniref:Endonuclease/exonuclease/phosphatase domain-containing protein n=1 Tax=Knipowitschia caucasica TaxID=637954 RepID=A0AAV2KFW0_KNICA